MRKLSFRKGGKRTKISMSPMTLLPTQPSHSPIKNSTLPFTPISPSLFPANYMTNHSSSSSPLRTYTLYITYSPYYRTPRLYLSGSFASGQPLPPHLMMEDIVGDYADKTVTLEDFPAYDTGLKMASIHPCKHASVMKVLLDRADAAMKLRLERLRAGRAQPSVGRVGAGEGEKVVGKGTVTGMEGLTEELEKAKIEEMGRKEGTKAAEKAHPDEWELLQEENNAAEEAIRVDQYLVVFLKVSAPTPRTRGAMRHLESVDGR